jgi:hypothetical protein
MALKFQCLGYNWSIRAGFPPMGSQERTDPVFVDALKAAHPPLGELTDHELASWIVARLCYLTSGALTVEGDSFAHDTDEFGYKMKITDEAKVSVAHGAVIFHAARTSFASVDMEIDDFQSVVVDLLTDSPGDLAACEIRVREPETRNDRTYGWNGYALLS